MKKKIIVTGGSSGIGLAIAKRFKKEGHSIIIIARTKKKLIKVCKKDDFLSYECGDLAIPEVAKKLIKNSVKKLNGLDILICNAGESKSCSPNHENFRDWQKMFKQNFFTASNVIETSKNFLRNSRGKIICVSSICGHEFVKGAPITYSTAKAALNFYIKSLSHYLAEKNITINLISPGNILFSGSVWDKKIKKNPGQVNEMLKDKVPLKKFGTLEDIVNMTYYLAMEESKYITGSNFIIDGGQTIKI